MTFRDTDKLSDNWRFSGTNHPVNEQTLNAYIEKHGIERALGYLEAIADIRAEISWILDHWHPNEGGFARTASKTQTMLREFEKHKESLLKVAVNTSVIIQDDCLILKLKQK